MGMNIYIDVVAIFTSHDYKFIRYAKEKIKKKFGSR